MSVRDTYWDGYGMTDAQVEKIVKGCRGAIPPETVLEGAKRANAAVACQIFANLTTGVGYDVMNKRQYIPMQRKDFQAYRRKAIYEIFLMIDGGGTHR